MLTGPSLSYTFKYMTSARLADGLNESNSRLSSSSGGCRRWGWPDFSVVRMRLLTAGIA